MKPQRLVPALGLCPFLLTFAPPASSQPIFTDGFEEGTVCMAWSAGVGQTPRCNGLDNDCDGSIDYDCECDPLLQNCPDSGDACYIRLLPAPGSATCDPPSSETPPGQDEECMFINGCAKGYHCILNDPVPSIHLDCTFACRPEGGEPSCATGATASHQCFEIRDYYMNTDTFPAGIGLCVPPP